MIVKKVVLSLMMLLFLAGCGPDSAEPVTLRLMTHDSFEIGAETLDQFSAETGIAVEIFKAGDGGQMVNQAVLARDNPLADVMYGVDNTFLSRALANDIFLAYASPELANIDDALKVDPQNRALPVDFGDVCLNYDKAWFAQSELDPPDSLDDLIDPAYAGLTVVQNPATSTPGLAFLFATIGAYGEDGFEAYWQALNANDVLVTNGWEDAYWGQFSGASDGDRPIVISYASSPPAEVLFAEEELSEAPTAAVTADGTCFRQIEFVGILNGTAHEAEAQQLVDFLLGRTFQEDIPLNMFVYPANNSAEIPGIFGEYSVLPQNPVTLNYDTIDQNREAWIQAWTEIVLQ
ncbi:MAG: thiamine ABC transporter substrate-binding protein [Anaerolineae bacterium]|nr:thiamine ABC transporter substrate-binding protein [Anaerolineae bacterium]MCO5197185.1 thiamine ABC transporter substrate-binding protein [Anaerolineae bacterium]